MEPRVSKRERKLHLSYELSHRIHCSSIYPIAGPNGSTVIVYGYDRGIRILWRGGRRRKRQLRATVQGQANGTSNGNHGVIDLDEDDDNAPHSQQEQQQLYEEHEEEEDPDCPYPDIISNVEVDLETEVLQLTIPLLPTQPPPRTAQMLKMHGVVAVSCSDGSQRVLTFPLAPPESTKEDEYADAVREHEVTIPGHGPICHAIAAKIVAADVLMSGEESQASDFLLVAAATNTLRIYQFSIFDEVTKLEQDASSKTVALPHPATQVSFHPSSQATQLLVADISGTVRLYEPYATASSTRRPSSSASGSLNAAPDEVLGKWTLALHTPFAVNKSGNAKRKRLLDAKWVLSGKAVLVLLEDGEWGIWDVSASGKAIDNFALRGFLGGTAAADTSASMQPKKGTRLAPMTPNTRKAKAEVLFSGTPKIPGAAARGGISVATSTSRAGSQDQSILLWYNGDVYSIPSLQSFWQRATTSTNSFGSLHSPGLAHITDINLINENVSSMSQFASPTSANAFGQMNTQRDLLVSAEHRLVILQSIRPPAPSRSLFQQASAPEQPALRDQLMLDSGEAGLGEINRMLDRMDQDVVRPRKVGFAH